jgi:hypothetical protein
MVAENATCSEVSENERKGYSMYYVIKRVINDYRVSVPTALDAKDALRRAINNEHDEGVLINDYNDGDTFCPSEWIVEDVYRAPLELSLAERSEFKEYD